MYKRFLAIVLTVIFVLGAGISAFADTDAFLDEAITLAVDLGRNNFVATLPYFCSDAGLDMLEGALNRYIAGEDAGLFHAPFDIAMQYTDTETLKKALGTLRLINPKVRENFQRTCQNNIEVSLTAEEAAGAEILMEYLVKKNGRFQSFFTEYGVTTGVLASYLEGAADLSGGGAMLKRSGSDFSLRSYDTAMVEGINAIWQPEDSSFDAKSLFEDGVASLNALTAAEKDRVSTLLYRVGMLEKSTGTDTSNKNDGNTPGLPQPGTESAGVVPFTDIANAWGREYIEALYLQGVIAGVTEELFMPDAYITREAFVKLIVELFDLQATSEALPFKDADPNAWYYPYVAAAYDNGLVQGVSVDAFGVGANIKRQDMAKILDSILAKKGITAVPGVPEAFADYEIVADYAKEAVLNMYGLGIISGDENRNFNPDNSATRQEAAKMIYGLQTAAKTQA